MRLYVAGTAGHSRELEARDVLTGLRNRLLSFDEIGGRSGRGECQPERFWVESGEAQELAMRVYFAGNLNGPYWPIFLWHSGVRRRLLSFAELKTQAAHDFRFWVEAGGGLDAYMKLYFAGNVKGEHCDADDYAHGVRNRLLSFADVEDWGEQGFRYWLHGQPPEASLFLDSGAFGAFMRGAVIDLGEYCEYIQEHQARIGCYAALDVIKDWQSTARNVAEMQRRGLAPIPTFHRGSPWAVLERLVAEHPYIALGGMVGSGKVRGTLTPESLAPHLDACWRVIERRWPVKVHVFGVIAQWVLERYPFYSADSATAIVSAGMGRVMRFDDGSGDVDGEGQLGTGGWQEHARDHADGEVMDGVSVQASGKNGSAHAGRRLRNVEAILGLQSQLTRMWQKRGVVWES